MLLNDMRDDDVDKRDIGEINTSLNDDEEIFFFPLNKSNHENIKLEKMFHMHTQDRW